MTTFTREDYELAAKAVGFIDDQTSDDEDSLGLRRNGQGIFYVVGKRGWHNWNPPEDDGDALRLAVKLDMNIGNGPGHSIEALAVSEHDGGVYGGVEQKREDAEAATRRAIFRAAIAIGKAMP